MIFYAFLFVGTFVVCLTEGQLSRSVSRSGPVVNVNLVEFNVRGVTYGKCVFYENGEEVEVTYEEYEGDVKAKASNPTILDPIVKTQQCRDAATRSIESQSTFRSNLGEEEIAETHRELEARLNDFQRKIALNQHYVSQLRPRFIGYSKNREVLITFGPTQSNYNKPEIGVALPDRPFTKATLGIGSLFPFKFGPHFGR